MGGGWLDAEERTAQDWTDQAAGDYARAVVFFGLTNTPGPSTPTLRIAMVPTVRGMTAAAPIRAKEQGIGNQGKGHGPAGRVRDQRSRACHEVAVSAGPGKAPRMYRNGGRITVPAKCWRKIGPSDRETH